MLKTNKQKLNFCEFQTVFPRGDDGEGRGRQPCVLGAGARQTCAEDQQSPAGAGILGDQGRVHSYRDGGHHRARERLEVPLPVLQERRR